MQATQVTIAPKKITLASVKSFINKNREKIFINVKSDFNGMTDCVEACDNGFIRATSDKTNSINSDYHEATMGINGVWFVRSSRDYFTNYNDDTFTGIEVSNCCGHFVIAIKKHV